MKITLTTKFPKDAKLYILPLFEDVDFEKSKIAPSQLKDIIKQRKKKKDFTAKKETKLCIVKDDPKLPEKILLYGLGRLKELDATKVRVISASLAKEIQAKQIKNINIHFPKELYDFAKPFLEGLALVNYNPNIFQTSKNKTENEKKLITKIDFQMPDKNTKSIKKDFDETIKLIEGVYFVRDLVNKPNNEINAETLSKIAKENAKEGGYKITILNKKQLEKLKMGALLGVNRGSTIEAKLVVMEYKPKKPTNKKPILLVGKGVTFDSGGYNLKPTRAIENMKEDMAGAGVVIGLFKLLKKFGINKHIIGITPLTENSIGPNAQAVNDIITTYSGLTVEVTNTDAEGRLILADAISYGIKKYSPSILIDLATLTGACMVALGDRYAGVLGNDETTIKKLIKAGETTDELVWQLPIHDDYRKKMKGKIADLINAQNTGLAGASTAAAFLENFVPKSVKWAHLDIAGVTLVNNPKPYDYPSATGYGVRLLMEYLKES